MLKRIGPATDPCGTSDDLFESTFNIVYTDTLFSTF